MPRCLAKYSYTVISTVCSALSVSPFFTFILKLGKKSEYKGFFLSWDHNFLFSPFLRFQGKRLNTKTRTYSSWMQGLSLKPEILNFWLRCVARTLKLLSILLAYRIPRKKKKTFQKTTNSESWTLFRSLSPLPSQYNGVPSHSGWTGENQLQVQVLRSSLWTHLEKQYI